MDFFNSIKIISLPKWLIAFMAALISSIFLFSFWLIYIGVILRLNESEITVAAISLVGTILPIILIGLILLFSDSGVKSLQQRTNKILSIHVPNSLKLIPDGLHSIQASENPRCHVRTNHIPNNFFSDYIIDFADEGRDIQIIIRLEINVKKVNINLYLNHEVICRRLNINTNEENKKAIDEKISSYFSHTKAGGELDKSDGRICYTFNEYTLPRNFENSNYLCIVGSSPLSDDFLWDSSEVLYFTQDLALMLRSFYQEHTELFVKN